MNGEDGIMSSMTLIPRDKVNEFLDNRLFPDAPVYIMGRSAHILHANARIVQVTPVDVGALVELKQEIEDAVSTP
jgi:hypothetical protein